jgi:hypothetical protein
MGRKILALSLVLVMALAFVACDGEPLPTAQEIIDGATQALGDVHSYEYEMDMTIDMVGESEGETFEANIGMDYSGALDLDNEQMRMEVTASVLITGEEETETALKAYLIDGTGYVMTDDPDRGVIWEKEEFSGADWAETWQSTVAMLSLVEPQMELLATAEVEVIGSEKVNGVDCYVLQVTPDIAQLWDTIMQQATLGFGGELGFPDFTAEMLEAIPYSYSAKQWLAKDTYFLMKAEMEMSMELTPEAMGMPEEEGEATIEIAMNMLGYNYNQPVSIELPPEAEEAIEY